MGKVELICEECGNLFEIYPSRFKYGNPRFCSPECHSKNETIYEGKTVNCAYCGEEKKLKGHQWKHAKEYNIKRFFCDKNCKARWQEENMTGVDNPFHGKEHDKETKKLMSKKHYDCNGPNNPAFDGWKSKEPYDEEWTEELREIIRDRDDHQCQFCGMPEEVHKLLYSQKLLVHHVDRNKKNNTIKNLLSMCRICHSRWHGRF